MINRSEEDWLVVKGLPRLSGTSDWQDNARRQVADLIKLVLHANRTDLNFEVVYVSNPFRFQPNRPNSYNVRMDSIRSAKHIRELFSGFFRRNRPLTKPPPLKGVSIRNKVTPDTKIRIAILHQFGSIYKEATVHRRMVAGRRSPRSLNTESVHLPSHPPAHCHLGHVLPETRALIPRTSQSIVDIKVFESNFDFLVPVVRRQNKAHFNFYF